MLSKLEMGGPKLRFERSDHADRALVVGENFLVVAANDAQEEPTVPVYLPGPEEWYDFWSGVRHKSGPLTVTNSPDHVPIFIRAGAILCTKSRARRSTEAQTGVAEATSFHPYID